MSNIEFTVKNLIDLKMDVNKRYRYIFLGKCRIKLVFQYNKVLFLANEILILYDVYEF